MHGMKEQKAHILSQLSDYIRENRTQLFARDPLGEHNWIQSHFTLGKWQLASNLAMNKATINQTKTVKRNLSNNSTDETESWKERTMVEQSSKRKRITGTGWDSLKLWFPFLHSRRDSSVTNEHSAEGRDIVCEDRERQREWEFIRARNQSSGSSTIGEVGEKEIGGVSMGLKRTDFLESRVFFRQRTIGRRHSLRVSVRGFWRKDKETEDALNSIWNCSSVWSNVWAFRRGLSSEPKSSSRVWPN